VLLQPQQHRPASALAAGAILLLQLLLAATGVQPHAAVRAGLQLQQRPQLLLGVL
jgi:hypothetical protein